MRKSKWSKCTHRQRHNFIREFTKRKHGENSAGDIVAAAVFDMKQKSKKSRREFVRDINIGLAHYGAIIQRDKLASTFVDLADYVADTLAENKLNWRGGTAVFNAVCRSRFAEWLKRQNLA